jgi:hypothetical protein
MKSPRFAFRIFPLARSVLIIFLNKDLSLCQFSVAGAFCRNEGESTSIIPFLFPDVYPFDQMVQDQQARDQQTLGLVTTMENTCRLVSADELKSHPVLQDIAKRTLKQTIECGYFIQGYTRRNFGGT